MRIYLDNCCYNRPYDDQTNLRIQIESQAKLAVQSRIRQGLYELVWSYVMDYENSKNPYEDKRESIGAWKHIASIDVQQESEEILQYAEALAVRGVKTFDALHVACAVSTKCDYFLTTDKKVLNTPVQELKIVNPVQFILEVDL